MTHPDTTIYHIISPVSLLDGVTTLADLAALHPNDNVFGRQGSFSQDGAAISMDCRSEDTWESYYSIEPRLAEFVFTAINLPSYLTLGCENTSYSDYLAITRVKGPIGTAWTPDLAEIT